MVANGDEIERHTALTDRQSNMIAATYASAKATFPAYVVAASHHTFSHRFPVISGRVVIYKLAAIPAIPPTIRWWSVLRRGHFVRRNQWVWDLHLHRRGKHAGRAIGLDYHPRPLTHDQADVCPYSAKGESSSQALELT